MNEKIIALIKKYLTSFGIMGVSTVAVLLLRDHFNQSELSVIYTNLADAFTIPAVVILMVGVMVWLSTTGGFDIFTYAISMAKNSFIPSADYKHRTFYDYKVSRADKRIKGYSFLFISGGIYMIPAIVFIILFACL